MGISITFDIGCRQKTQDAFKQHATILQECADVHLEDLYDGNEGLVKRAGVVDYQINDLLHFHHKGGSTMRGVQWVEAKQPA
jgi:hypothetical protein